MDDDEENESTETVQEIMEDYYLGG